MKGNRTKNATRNMVFGLLLKLYHLLVPFLMRTAMIYLLGVQYLGLNGLFTSVLQVLNLAELGVGSAMTFSMYKPIAENDEVTICALMRLYKIYYRIIGIVILSMGLCLLPFIPNLIASDVPADINIYVLYVMNLMATVLTYWLFAYKNCILSAHQRSDISSKVHFVTDTIMYVTQISVLAIFHNYYLYVMANLVTRALTNIIISRVADRMYPQFQAKGKLPKENVDKINQRIKDLFTSKLGVVVNENLDTVIVSAFLGLTTLAIYQNYFYMVKAVIGVMKTVLYSCMAGIGNSLVVETKEHNYANFKKFTFIVCWLSGVCFACFVCLYQPFMELWMGKELMLDFSYVLLFSIYFFIYEIFTVINIYKDAAGIWHEDRFRPLICAIANLIMNLALIKFIGLYAVLLSTVLSLLVIGIPWLIHNVFSFIFDTKQIKEYVWILCKSVVMTGIACAVTYFVCEFVPFDAYIELFVKLVICGIVPNIVFLCIYGRSDDFKGMLVIVNRMTGGKIKPLKRYVTNV